MITINKDGSGNITVSLDSLNRRYYQEKTLDIRQREYIRNISNINEVAADQ
jgi:hypothetical protein